jgi:hypothetical protein
MDAERSGTAMTDTAIDREIQAALAVDPSPDFLARVRTRIATEPPKVRSWVPWTLAAAGAMAAIVAIAVVISWPQGKPTPVTQAPGAEDIRLAAPTAIEQPRRAEAPEARRRPEPEILIDPAEVRALRRLITGTRDGSLDLSAALQATTPTAMELPPIKAIVIAPLTIDPLTPSGEEGVRP